MPAGQAKLISGYEVIRMSRQKISEKNLQSNEPGEERSRKSKMKRRTDGWEAAKAEVAKELGLWDKVQAEGWASLTASESGRLGGVLSGRFPGKAPQREPKRGKNADKSGDKQPKIE